MSHATDYPSRAPRRACQHPAHMIRRSGGSDFRVCTACGAWRGTLAMGDYHDMILPPSMPQDAAQRIANGEPWSKVFPLPRLPKNWRTG